MMGTLSLSELCTQSRARICKRLRSIGIDSKESLPQAYVDCRAGTSNRESIPGLLERFTNPGSDYNSEKVFLNF
jgi:hypothetical protein